MNTVTTFSIALEKVTRSPAAARDLLLGRVYQSREEWQQLSPSAKRATANDLLGMMMIYSSECRHFARSQEYAISTFSHQIRSFLLAASAFLATSDQQDSLRRLVPVPEPKTATPGTRPEPKTAVAPAVASVKRQVALQRIALEQLQRSTEQQAAYLNKKINELRRKRKREDEEEEGNVQIKKNKF